jgi:hypothetical protein
MLKGTSRAAVPLYGHKVRQRAETALDDQTYASSLALAAAYSSSVSAPASFSWASF